MFPQLKLTGTVDLVSGAPTKKPAINVKEMLEKQNDQRIYNDPAFLKFQGDLGVENALDGFFNQFHGQVGDITARVMESHDRFSEDLKESEKMTP